MPLRYSVPVLQTRRGAGLGNEVLAWGKAFIGAQELGLTCVTPTWGLNRREYWRDFETTRLDVISDAARRALPTLDITAEMVAGFDDYADAMRSLRSEVDAKRGPLVVRHSSGMAGGYLSVRRARTFLLSELLKPKHVAEDLYRVWRGIDDSRPVVGMHVRGGDFAASPGGPGPGHFNEAIPIDWYLNVGSSIRRRFPDCQILLFTDDPGSLGVKRLGQSLHALTAPARPLPVLSDVLSMARCDLMVCSVSSLSMLVGFLSDKPYIWFRPQLWRTGSALSIWGHEEGQRQGVTSINAAQMSDLVQGRACAVPRSGEVPEGFWRLMEANLLQLDRRADLLYYGVLPATDIDR